MTAHTTSMFARRSRGSSFRILFITELMSKRHKFWGLSIVIILNIIINGFNNYY